MSAKTKLLYLLQCYHNRGGVEEHCRTLAAGLANGFDIRIAAPEKEALVVIKDAAVVEQHPADIAPWPLTPYSLEKTQESLTTLLHSFKPDIVHVQHFHGWHLGLFDQLIQYGAPVAVSFHDYYAVTPYWTMQGAPTPEVALSPEYCAAVFRADILAQVRQRVAFLQAALPRCQAFICPSNYLARQLGTLFPLPFQVIEHGIHSFEPAPLAPEARKRFGCIGSKLPQKGWMELLKAFQILQLQMPSAEIVFFGGGQKAPAKASPGVYFTGTYEPQHIPQIMGQFEIGIIPSMFAETFSYTLSELWMGQKAVGASAIGALGDRIEDGKNGRLFPAGDIPAMVATLRWFLESDEWRGWNLPEPRLVDPMLDDYRKLYVGLLGAKA